MFGERIPIHLVEDERDADPEPPAGFDAMFSASAKNFTSQSKCAILTKARTNFFYRQTYFVTADGEYSLLQDETIAT